MLFSKVKLHYYNYVTSFLHELIQYDFQSQQEFYLILKDRLNKKGSYQNIMQFFRPVLWHPNFWFWEYLSLICKGWWWMVPDFFRNLNKVIFVWKHWLFFLQFCEIKVPNSKMSMSKFCKIFKEFLMHKAFTILYNPGKILNI